MKRPRADFGGVERDPTREPGLCNVGSKNAMCILSRGHDGAHQTVVRWVGHTAMPRNANGLRAYFAKQRIIDAHYHEKTDGVPFWKLHFRGTSKKCGTANCLFVRLGGAK